MRPLAADLSERCRTAGLPTEVRHGLGALIELSAATEVDAVMAAIVGAAGLEPTLAAARAGKKVMLANKEVLVMAGELFMHAVRQHGARLLPVDSEHNAIFQSLPVDFERGLAACGVGRILLTASGGPFRNTPLAALQEVTPDQACAHPNWVMGRKISVDSATMMNKGLEVIEARWIFDAPPEMIQVVVHPQSVVHSAVQYVDGSVLAQLGNPDMRTRSPMPWPGQNVSMPVSRRSICLPSDGSILSGSRSGAFPLPATGLRCAQRRWYGPGHPQCGQRNCRRGLSRASIVFPRHRSTQRGGSRCLAGRTGEQPGRRHDCRCRSPPDSPADDRGAAFRVSELLFYLAAFAVVLGVLIVFHEYGHYAAARLCGVKVLRFSIGFGHVLWQKRLGRDGTEWAISAFPLGGYVKMLDEREGNVAPEEAIVPSTGSRSVAAA
jgi:hypothetical protein